MEATKRKEAQQSGPEVRDADGYGCLAVIHTAVEVETASLRQQFSGIKPFHLPGDSQSYYRTEIQREGTSHTIYLTQQKVMGMTAATGLATKCIYAFRPRYLIMCGIAAGLGEESSQMYGDVIVPEMIWDYSTGKFVGPDESEIRFGDVGFLPRPVSLPVDPYIRKVVEASMEDPNNEYHVHLGPMACGSAVVANEKVVDKQIRSLFPRTVGLDMESYSIYFASANCSDPRPTPLVVKSICDFANSDKSDRYQKFAAYTSSGYVKYLLENWLEV